MTREDTFYTSLFAPHKITDISDPFEKAFLDLGYVSMRDAYLIDISGLYASCSYINLHLARVIVPLLFSEKMEIEASRIENIDKMLTKYFSFFSWGCEQFQDRLTHLHNSLAFLQQSKEAKEIVRRVTRPYANRLAETIIRDTLELDPDHAIVDFDAKKALLVALMTKLRQSLGSCFATAPAILIQEEEPIQLLRDLEMLLSSGMIRKTVRGVEYTVPMSRTWGNGELKKIFSLIGSSTGIESDASQDIWKSPILLSSFQEAGIEIGEKELYRYLFLEWSERNTGIKNSGPIPFGISCETVIDSAVFRSFGVSLQDRKLQEKASKGSLVIKDLDPATTLSWNTIPEKETKSLAPDVKRRNNDEEKKRLEETIKRLSQATIKAQEIKRRVKMKGECALLKVWEFTIASYAEVKFDLFRWNIYSSLGVNWNDEGGIGQVLYQIAHTCVEDTKREIEEIQQKFDAINLEVSYLEQRVRQASSEQELSWIKMEYQSRKTEQYHLQETVDMMAKKARQISGIHQFLIDQYDVLFKEYFQEIYDADLHDVDVGPFDDSPAGFRLIYKHGRSNPSLWSPIYSLEEYIDALASFFSLTEQQLSLLPEIKGIEKEFSLIITRLITHVRSPFFQETALNRTQRAHGLPAIKNAIQNVDILEKKPWVFTSGGSMESLVSSYFKLEGEIDKTERWVENETELLSFLIDTTRLSSNRQKGAFQKSSYAPSFSPARSLLMHSPTHAFRLLPNMPLFHQAWTSDTYSYSWIYNKLRDPSQNMLKDTLLPPEVVERALYDAVLLFPKPLQNRALDTFRSEVTPFLRIFDFASVVRDTCRKDRELRQYEGHVFQSGLFDEKIYSHFPYQSYQSGLHIVEEGVASILGKNMWAQNSETVQKFVQAFTEKTSLQVFSAFEIRQIFMSILHRMKGVDTLDYALLQKSIAFLRKKGALLPEPVIVADSNWVQDYFAFLVSPISLQIEFWAVSLYGTTGRPIPHWKKWLNGSDTSRTWGVFINPMQYHA